VVERELRMNTFLQCNIHRMRHAMCHGVTVPAKAHDILDEKPVGSYRLSVVTMKTPRRFTHKGVRVLCSFSYVRCQEDQENQAAKPDLFNSS
jgi:hypothetical protein